VALIIDVTFQPCYRPTGRFYEARHYWSHKHYQYGIKTEVGTSPNGCAMFVSKHYPGSVHDFTLFSKNLQNYQSFLQKKTTDNSINDIGELRNKYPHSWALMADRGYEGAARFIRAILPKKGTRLSLEDTTRNRKFNEHRVIIENFFGRMKLLWKIVSVRYRWDHSIYDKIMKICVAFTNFHISLNPLRVEYYDRYHSVMKAYEKEGRERELKRKHWQETYRRRQKARRQEATRINNDSETEQF